MMADPVNPEAVQRKLAALLSADVVGYSRLMAQDEVATLKTLNAHRDAMGGLIRQHGGRVVDAVGDNLLAEFPSVVDAVACAVAIQRELGTRNADLPAQRQMPFRIGIHLGDVMVDGERIYGDGVNIAARLETVAEAGGICISGTVHEQVRHKLSQAYEDLGEQSLKNIADPVRVYRVRPAPAEEADEAAALTVPGFGGRPAIAVLAFDNLSGDPEQEYFADGIAEDLITRLSAFRLFPVIARNSSFTYKGKSVDVKQVSRELGVRYVVEGSVRRSSAQVRISAQLIDATTGHHLWAERYDRKLGDIFALQDEITETIIASLEPTLERVERRRVIRHAAQNLDAWECVQRGWWHLSRVRKGDNVKARALFRRATELDSHFSRAFSGLAVSHAQELTYGWSESPAQAVADGLTAADRSVVLGEGDPRAHVALGDLSGFAGQFDRAVAAHTRATELDPSFALAHFGLGCSLTASGRADDGIVMLEKAIRLSPRDRSMHLFLSYIALAHFVAERYDETVVWAKKSLELQPNHSMPWGLVAAAYGHLGQKEEAQAALDARERLHVTEEHLRIIMPPAILQRYLDGWRKAGWKE
jgi:adenylate cyclase